MSVICTCVDIGSIYYLKSFEVALRNTTYANLTTIHNRSTILAPFIMTPSTPSTPTPTRGRGTGKRGRKPRGALPHASTDSPRPPPQSGASSSTMRFTPVQWATPTVPAGVSITAPSMTAPSASSTAANAGDLSMDSGDEEPVVTQPAPVTAATSSTATVVPQSGAAVRQPGAPDEDAEGEDELLPAMADDDYSAQLSWQSESKDNLK